jgi:class 3 adenylate cyclase
MVAVPTNRSKASVRTPLRRKILLYSSSVLVGLIVLMLVYVNWQAGQFVNDRIQSELLQGRDRIKAVESERLEKLRLTATVVASLPSFFALLESNTNTLTIHDFLQDYQRRTATDLLIALNEKGEVVGRSDRADAEGISSEQASAILQTPRGTYHVAMAAADSTGRTLGQVIAGYLIDDQFAQKLKTSRYDEVVISAKTVLGSTLSRPALPWQTQADWEKTVGKDANPRAVTVDGEHYLAVGNPLGDASGPFAVLMQSRDQALRPYQWIQRGLFLIGLVVALVGIASSAVLARTITAPVAKLVEGTQQVAAGNFDYRLDIPATDEIGDLARSFNTMIQGLREHADMQKFVSMSTVEMIQSANTKKISAGEKVVLTVLFSDMRGFTSMSEHRTPEDTVRVLNACLSLQAGKVQKFHGDVDKFIGDAVLALFQGEDMELNAIRCATEIHEVLEELNAKNGSQPPIRVGIGIVTGEVILGSIGSENRLDYTVIGSNVNLCSRLCSNAAPGETLLAESTYARVRNLINARKSESLRVKGFSEPVLVYKM